VTARILQFPQRTPFTVRVEREHKEAVWLVIARRHGWIHGNRREAIAEAKKIANKFGVSIEVASHD
jgi:hypothetical protein